MNNSKSKLIAPTAFFIISIMSFVLEFKAGLMFSLAAVWLWGLSYTLKRLNDRVVLFAFHLTIFTFLMARLFIDDFASGYTSDYTENAQTVAHYSRSAEYFIYFVLTLSLYFVQIGYLFRNKEGAIEVSMNKSYSRVYIDKVKVISKRLSYLLYVFTIFTTLEMIMYIWSNGYLAYYLSFNHSLPHAFYTLDAAFGFAFFLFLACMPEKKEAKPLIYLYLLRACLALLSGQRSSFILPALFIVIYLFLRSSMTPEDPWIGRKGKIALLASFPFVCASMFVVMLIRGDNAGGNEGLFTYFLDFFYQQGGSVKILGLSYDMQGNIPDGQLYSLGPLIRWFDGNFVTQLLGLGHRYEEVTVEMAMKGHNLGSFLTYNSDEYKYLNGGNYASSYIAELWLDFGYVGVVVGSIIYGRIMADVLTFAKNNLWKATIAFIMMYNIIYAPRACYIYFITECMSYSFIVIVIYINFNTRNLQSD